MTTQLLAQALAVASSPHSSTQQLIDVAGDLVSFGALDAAESALRRVRERGELDPASLVLERSIDWLRRFGVRLEESFLTNALAVAAREGASEEQLLRAAETLLICGSLDEADRVLTRVSSNAAYAAPVARLAAASRQLRRSGILKELRTLTPRDSLNKPYEVLLRRRAGARRTIIVFSGIMLRFWLSLNVLHIFLRKLDANIIYLNDHSACLYLNGLASVGRDYNAMIGMLREQIRQFGSSQVFVLAISAGGFVGLRAAMDLKAESFAGMSIRSTLARSTDEPLTPFAKDLVERCKDPSMFVDLADLLADSEYPRSIQLYCGEHNTKDRFQAERLTHIPRAEIVSVPGYRLHNPISGLIARGQFEAMLQKFVRTAAPEATGAVSVGTGQ
jgi:hypothetical protein